MEQDVGRNDDRYALATTPTRTPEVHRWGTSDHRDEVEHKQEDETAGVSLTVLFRYADAKDRVLMVVGAVGGLGAGMSEPLQVLLFGNVLNAFDPGRAVTLDDEMRASVNRVALDFVLVGVIVLVCGVLQMTCWSITGARQARRLRSAYVAAILSKDIGWFDVHESHELATRVAAAAVTIQEALGCRMGDAIRFVSMAVSGVAIGIWRGWELALLLLACMPAVAASIYFATKVLARATKSSLESYSQAGAIAEEAIGNIRTVHTLNAMEHFQAKYARAQEQSARAGIQKSIAVGWGTGLMFFTTFCAYAGAMYFGSWKIANDQIVDGGLEKCQASAWGCYDGGRVITVFFSVMAAAMALGQGAPCFQAITAARAAAVKVFEVIDEPSRIDPTETSGKVLAKVTGDVEFRDVTFAYPSRPEVSICRSYSLKIRAGETVALVGMSGSGKSTVVSLLERFYDPIAGCVLLDGHDLRELNVKWLRRQIGLVGQEPVLFSASILENIRHGRPDATDDEVMEAARRANAFEFVMEFPSKFETPVGERGAQLSGGQKQRIAIARALVKNPSVLLLDEATSALDTASEKIVQQSLDALLSSESSSKRTTIVVAHRLSTIRNASRIAVHYQGTIVEIGSHDELVAMTDGHYQRLISTQESTSAKSITVASGCALEAPASITSIDRSDRSRIAEHELSRRSFSPEPHPSFSTNERIHKGSKVADSQSDNEENPDEELPPMPTRRLWSMTLLEWKFLLLGSVGAIVNGAIYPAWGVILANLVVLFYHYDYDKDEMMSHAMTWTWAFIVLGVLFGVSHTVQHFGFGVVSQRLISRVRNTTFCSTLRQDIAWYDLPSNSSGALVARLATDSTLLQSATSDLLNQTLVNMATLGIALAISLYHSWEITLGVFATLPVFVFSEYMQIKSLHGTLHNKESNTADIEAASIFNEGVGSIRTTAAFSLEAALSERYAALLRTSRKMDARAGMITGLNFGVAQGVMFWNLGFLLWLGGLLVSKNYVAFADLTMVLVVIMMSTIAVGSSAQNQTGKAEAQRAARNIFSTIDREPAIDAAAITGETLPSRKLRGDITFESVGFAYPARPDKAVYSNYSLTVRSGQTVALVGASGSGKSTAIALLERFYDPLSGRVTLDGVDLRELNLPWVRDRVSLVSQEPVLFSGTIGENIAMGKPDATRTEVEEAAKQANAFDFISNFPDGFDTQVGDRGAQVSGGQKQRIAIARAILRDPDVLLLDEATSALDNESERAVQASLDALMAAKQRTTIVVAHRLSTIQRADLICVTQDGVIVERGTHAELMQLPEGVYRELVAHQVQTTAE
jgi:ATP-binding cassette subfamily B (MDR/TAP) protein 1